MLSQGTSRGAARREVNEMEEEQYGSEIYLEELKKKEKRIIKETLDTILEIFSHWMSIGMMYYGNHKLMLIIDDKPIPLADYMKKGTQREEVLK